MISQINFVVEGLGQFSTYRSGKQDRGWASFYMMKYTGLAILLMSSLDAVTQDLKKASM